MPEPARRERAERALAPSLGAFAVGVSMSALVVAVMALLLALVTGSLPTAVRDDALSPPLVRGDLVWFSDAPTGALGLGDVVRARIDGAVLVGRPLAINRSVDGSTGDTVTMEVAGGEVLVPAAGLERARLVLPVLGLPVLWVTGTSAGAGPTAVLVLGSVALVASFAITVRSARRRSGAASAERHEGVSASG